MTTSQYVSRPGTEGADRVYFNNPWKDWQGEKFQQAAYAREAVEEFYRQTATAGYYNTRDWEQDPA